MFFRTKTSGPRTYLQVVENRWEGGRSRQRVVATLGRLDQLQQSGQLDGLLASGARLARSVLLLSEHAQGRLPTISIRRIGAALVFQRLWQQTGCQHVIQQLLKGRRFEFSIERAVFLTVLHRLFDPGSDRAADTWKNSYEIEGCEDLQLHHLYRAMGWLGDDLPRKEQTDKTPFAPRCNRDGHDLEWADVIGDLGRLQMVEVEQDGKRFLLRSEVQGTCGTVFRAAGVAVPPTVQQAAPEPAATPPDPGATPRM